jgi:multiple sugar transport system ATP-binding protein
MGDRIVVMSDAAVQQVGTPHDVYNDPSNLFVARFIGSPGMNLLKGIYRDGIVHLPGVNQFNVPEQWRLALENSLSNDSVILGFRPEGALASDSGEFHAEVYASDLHGAFNMMHVALEEENVEAMVHIRGERGSGHKIGDNIRFRLESKMVRFFDPVNEQAIFLEATP